MDEHTHEQINADFLALRDHYIWNAPIHELVRFAELRATIARRSDHYTTTSTEGEAK